MRRTIATALIITAGALAYGTVTTPTMAGTPAPAYVTCAEEDGSTPGQAFPCMWDAQHQGNGQGESYILIAPVCTPEQVAASDAAHRAGRPISLPCDDLESLIGF